MKYQLLPNLSADEYATLKADIRKRGVLVPIVQTDDGAILDGHHRLRAIAELKQEGISIDPPVIVQTGLNEGERRATVRALNLARRLHLTTAQKRKIILEQLLDTPQLSDRTIAKRLGVTHPTVASVRRKHGKKLQSRRRVGADGKIRRVPKRAILAANPTEATQTVKLLDWLGEDTPSTLTATDARLRAKKRQVAANRDGMIAKLGKPANLGKQKFSIVYADPPWEYGQATTPNRHVSNHYPSLSTEELSGLPVSQLTTKNAILFLWATAPVLPEALAVLKAWGFAYKTQAVWDKVSVGMGNFFRGQHELLLIGTKGKFPTPPTAKRIPSVFSIPRGNHSAKPIEVRQLIDWWYPTGQRVELFARDQVEGWVCWGNEVPV